MTSTAAPSLWRNRAYLLWLISDTAKGLGGALVGFAIPLIALFVTDDPAQAGIIAGVGMVVRLILTLAGGALADRHDRIRMMLVGAVVATGVGLGFTVLSWADTLTFTVLLAAQTVLSAHAGAFEPAGESALREIVPDAAMGRAQAANQGRDAVLELAGGPLGGALLALGAWVIGAVMTLAYAVAGVTAWLLHRRVRVDRAKGEADESPAGTAVPDAAVPNMLREIGEGFVWLFARPDLRSTILVATIINLGFSTALTTVIYALQQAGHSTVTIGLLSTAAGGAMLVGALFAPLMVSRLRASVVIIGGLAVASIAVSAMALVRDPWAIAAVLAATVFFIPAVNAALMGYFMVATPSHLLGRANSAAGVLGMGALPLAPLLAGFGLSWAGREATLLVASALCAVSVLLAISGRGLRALPAEARWSEHAAQFTTR